MRTGRGAGDLRAGGGCAADSSEASERGSDACRRSREGGRQDQIHGGGERRLRQSAGRETDAVGGAAAGHGRRGCRRHRAFSRGGKGDSGSGGGGQARVHDRGRGDASAGESGGGAARAGAGRGRIYSATAKASSANGDPRTDVAIQWSSKSPAIAKVDDSGLVTAVAPGTATLDASGGPVSGEVSVRVVADTVQKIALEPAASTAKTGDVVHFTAKAESKAAGTKDLLTTWSVSGPRATIYPDGAFVAELPGTYEITASIGRHSAVASVEVAPRNAQRELEVVSHIPTQGADGKAIQTTEEWVVGNHLYIATFGDRILAYDVSDPAHPKALDSLKADARLFNDVSTTPDEKWACSRGKALRTAKMASCFLTHPTPRSESAFGIHGNGYGRRAQRVHQYALRLHHGRCHGLAARD